MRIMVNGHHVTDDTQIILFIQIVFAGYILALRAKAGLHTHKQIKII